MKQINATCPSSQLNCPSDVAVRGSVHRTTSGLHNVLPRDLVSCEDRGESFHNERSLSVLQHHKPAAPSNLNDERQSEAPASGNKQSTAL